MARSRKAEEQKTRLDLKSQLKTPPKKIDKLQLIQEEKQKVLEARELYQQIISMMPSTENNMVVRVIMTFILIQRKIVCAICGNLYLVLPVLMISTL